MANRIVLKRSSVATKVPLATDLEVGELAVNLVDQKLYSKKADGTVILVGSGLGGAGTVTSVALSLPNVFSVSGSPVTTSGTLTASLVSQTQKTFFAAPNAADGTPTFRAIVASDIPTLNQHTTGNAATATALQTARTINGVSFDGTANITVTAANPSALTIGTGLSGTSYNGSSAVTIAIDSTVTTLTGTQTLTNKTLTNPAINGFTGDTSVINVGSGQFYKDTSGNIGLGTTSPSTYGTENSKVLSLLRIDQAVAIGAHYELGVRQYGFIRSSNLSASAGCDFLIFTGSSAAVQCRAAIGGVGIYCYPDYPLDVQGSIMRLRGAGAGYAFVQYGTSGNSAQNWYVGSEGNGDFNWYNGNADGVRRMYLTFNGYAYNTSGVWGTISDERVKENIQDAPSYLQKILDMRVRKYSLKEYGLAEPNMLGLIAQEVENVSPGLVYESQYKVDSDPEGPGQKIVKMSVLLPMLIKAFQEQNQIIQEMQQQIIELKG